MVCLSALESNSKLQQWYIGTQVSLRVQYQIDQLDTFVRLINHIH